MCKSEVPSTARAWPRSPSLEHIRHLEPASARSVWPQGSLACPAPEVPLDAETLLALSSLLCRTLRDGCFEPTCHEQPGHPPARIEAGFHEMRGLWGVRQSDRARGGRNCLLRCARARRVWRRGALRAGFSAFGWRCARRRSVLALACSIARCSGAVHMMSVGSGGPGRDRERQKSGPGT